MLKLREVADSVTGAVPVPLRLTVCGLLIALSAKVRVPVAAPSAVGVKVTPTVQVAPAAMPVPHVLLAMANGLPAGMEMPVNVSAVLSRLVTVTVFAALVLPTASEPKLRLLEENVTGALPLPVTVDGLRSGVIGDRQDAGSRAHHSRREDDGDGARCRRGDAPAAGVRLAERSCDRNVGDLQRPRPGALHGDVLRRAGGPDDQRREGERRRRDGRRRHCARAVQMAASAPNPGYRNRRSR